MTIATNTITMTAIVIRTNDTMSYLLNSIMTITNYNYYYYFY